MPAIRIARRRRSSIAIPPRAGKATTPRSFTFAPNVTPGTYVPPADEQDVTTSDADDMGEDGEPSSSGAGSAALFPPSSTPTEPAPSRRRQPPGKRRSLGYIPRPPNAFMLFRADFVRQKHVPGSIETNHGSLSKIIGNCWRALPLEERNVWEHRARAAKAEHKIRYPEYRFRPVHNKEKKRKAAALAAAQAALASSSNSNSNNVSHQGSSAGSNADADEEDERCQAVANLLLEGKKGEDLTAAYLESQSQQRGRTMYNSRPHRRSSSVPLPTHGFSNAAPIALPILPSNLLAPMSWGSSFSMGESSVPSIRQQQQQPGQEHQQGWYQPQTQYGYGQRLSQSAGFNYAQYNSGAGLRRASSTLPVLQRTHGSGSGWSSYPPIQTSSMWYDSGSLSSATTPTSATSAVPDTLPNIDTSFVNPFSSSNISLGSSQDGSEGPVSAGARGSFNFSNFLQYLPEGGLATGSENPLSPLDPVEGIAPHESIACLPSGTDGCVVLDSATWLPVPQQASSHSTDLPTAIDNQSQSYPSSTHSNSPDASPDGFSMLHAPVPMHAFSNFSWNGAAQHGVAGEKHNNNHHGEDEMSDADRLRAPSMGLGLHFPSASNIMDTSDYSSLSHHHSQQPSGCDEDAALHCYHIGLETFNIAMGGLVCVDGANANNGGPGGELEYIHEDGSVFGHHHA